MPNTIKLKPASQMGASLAPGELAIDEAGRALYLDKGTGPEAIPLDRQPLPKTPRPVDKRAIVIKGVAGPEWALLEGAGGGPSLADRQGYIVPGCRPVWALHNLNISATSPAAPFTALFQVNESIVVKSLLIRPAAGVDIQFTFGIRAYGGASVYEQTESAYAGALEQAVHIPLDPGHYETYVYVESTLQFKSLGYLSPWDRGDSYNDHVLWMRVN